MSSVLPFDPANYFAAYGCSTTLSIEKGKLKSIIYSYMQVISNLYNPCYSHKSYKLEQNNLMNWETTKVTNAKFIDYYTRVQKERKSDNCYLDSKSDVKEREFSIYLDFLKEGKRYKTEIGFNTSNSEYNKYPKAYEIVTKEAHSTSELAIKLAKGINQAIRFAAY